MLNGSFVTDQASLHPGPEGRVGINAIRYVRLNIQLDQLESHSVSLKQGGGGGKKSIVRSLADMGSDPSVRTGHDRTGIIISLPKTIIERMLHASESMTLSLAAL